MKTTYLQHSKTVIRPCEQLSSSEDTNELDDFDLNEEIYNESSSLGSEQEDEWGYDYPYDDEYEYDPNYKISQTIHILEKERTPEEEHALSEFISQERNRWHLNLVYHKLLPNRLLKVVKEEHDPEWNEGTNWFTETPPRLIQVLYELNEDERHEIYKRFNEMRKSWETRLEFYELLPNGILKFAGSLE